MDPFYDFRIELNSLGQRLPVPASKIQSIKDLALRHQSVLYFYSRDLTKLSTLF
jgi:hypothetical protein